MLQQLIVAQQVSIGLSETICNLFHFMMMIVICHSACVIKHYRHVAIDWNFTRHIFFFSPIVPDTLYCIKIISVGALSITPTRRPSSSIVPTLGPSSPYQSLAPTLDPSSSFQSLGPTLLPTPILKDAALSSSALSSRQGLNCMHCASSLLFLFMLQILLAA